MQSGTPKKLVQWYKSPPLICAAIACAILVVALIVTLINGAANGFDPSTRTEWVHTLASWSIGGATFMFFLAVVLYIRQSILRATGTK